MKYHVQTQPQPQPHLIPFTSNHRSHTPSHSVVSTVNLFEHLFKISPIPPRTILAIGTKENRKTKTHTLKVLIIDSHLIRLLTSLCGPFKSQLKASISLSSQSLRSTGGLRRLPLAIYWARVASSETGKDSTTGAIFAGPCWKTGGKRSG